MRKMILAVLAALSVGAAHAQETAAPDAPPVEAAQPGAAADLEAVLSNSRETPAQGEDETLVEEAVSQEAPAEAPTVVVPSAESVEEAVEEAVDDAISEAVDEVIDGAVASQPAVPDTAVEAEVDETVAQPEAQDSTNLATEGLPAEAPHGLYEEIGSAGDWTAIRFEPVENRVVCAIFSRPTDSLILEGGNAVAALRGERAAFITWEDGQVRDEGGVFSAIIGAPLDSQFEGHSAATDTESFGLFGYEDRLFVEPENDAMAIAAIRRGLSLTLTAHLPGDRQAKDTYSLRGVQASTELAREACPAS